jgi:hypothetical protein
MKIAGYEIHPLAECWPRIEGPDWEDFLFSVESGVKVPPVADQHGRIVDGINRLTAWAHHAERVKGYADLKPLKVETREFKDEEEIYRFILVANAERRHITRDQKTMACTAMFDQFKKAAAKAAEATKFKPGQSGNPTGKAKEQARMNSCEPASERDHKAEHTRRTVGRIAKEAGVSHHKAAQAVTVKKNSPELAEEVSRGNVPLNVAAEIARDPELVEQIKANPEVAKEIAKAVSERPKKAGKKKKKKEEQKEELGGEDFGKFVREGDVEKIGRWLKAASLEMVRQVVELGTEILNNS